MAEPAKSPHTVSIPANRYFAETGTETSVISLNYALRRFHGIVVIENLNATLDNDQELRDVWRQACAKPDRTAVLIHLPVPKYVTSLVMVALREVGREAKEKHIPFMAVLHPKLRLLLHMFELDDVIPTEERLDLALRALQKQVGG